MGIGEVGAKAGGTQQIGCGFVVFPRVSARQPEIIVGVGKSRRNAKGPFVTTARFRALAHLAKRVAQTGPSFSTVRLTCQGGAKGLGRFAKFATCFERIPQVVANLGRIRVKFGLCRSDSIASAMRPIDRNAMPKLL